MLRASWRRLEAIRPEPRTFLGCPGRGSNRHTSGYGLEWMCPRYLWLQGLELLLIVLLTAIGPLAVTGVWLAAGAEWFR